MGSVVNSVQEGAVTEELTVGLDCTIMLPSTVQPAVTVDKVLPSSLDKICVTLSPVVP